MTIGSVRLSAAVRFTANVSDQSLPFAVYRPGAAGVKTVSTGIAAAPSPGGMTVTSPPAWPLLNRVTLTSRPTTNCRDWVLPSSTGWRIE